MNSGWLLAQKIAFSNLFNRNGAPLRSAVFLTWCKAFSAEFGLNLTPHGLRKNATIALFEAGCKTSEIAAITGHKSLAMLEHYGKQRSQPKLATRAIGCWAAAGAKQEWESSSHEGKRVS